MTISAHRRDEYLQAARIALRPDGVTIQLDLTPGIDVADAIISSIDRDASGSLSTDEQRAYAGEVIRALDVRLDDAPLQVRLESASFPDPSAMRGGEGTIRLQASAAHHRLTGGAHQVYLRNAHRQRESAYLANALAPDSAGISILGQRRDPRQRELTIDYTVRADAVVSNAGWLLAGLPIVALLVLRLTRR